MSGRKRDRDDLAWKIHGNLSDWTARVDNKASILLALQAASLALVVGLAGTGRGLGAGCDFARWSLGVGVLLLCAAAVLAALAVLPQLRRRHLSQESKRNFIYFGHLRNWKPDALAEAMSDDPDILDQLSHQIVIMAKIAWRKHVWLQWSLYAMIAALVFVAPFFVVSFVGGAQ